MIHRDRVRQAVENVLRHRDGPPKVLAAAERDLLLLFDPSFDYKMIVRGTTVLTLIWYTLDPGDGHVAIDEAIYEYRPAARLRRLVPVGKAHDWAMRKAPLSEPQEPAS